MLAYAKQVADFLISPPQKTSLPHDLIFFQIKPFKDNDRGVNHRDTVCKNIISLKSKQIVFFIKGNTTKIQFFVGVPKDFKQFFQNNFYSSYPTSDLVEVSNISPSSNQQCLTFKDPANIIFKEEFVKGGTYMDPMNNLLTLYNNIDEKSSLELTFTYTFKLEKDFWQNLKEILVWIWGKKKKAPAEGEKPEKEPIKPDLFLMLSYAIHSKDKYMTDTIKNNLKAAFSTFSKEGDIKPNKKPVFMPVQYDQVVNFFHLPTQEHFTKGVEYTLYRKLSYPTNLPNLSNTPAQELTMLGKTDYRGDAQLFGIRQEDKFRHMYILGKTGTGKSTLIENLIASDMKAGNGVCVLDPHGELVDHVLEYIPQNRINDVILFDVSDTDYPIGFNLLQANTEEEKNLVASGVVSTFYKLFGTSWGPRLEYILRNVVISLVDYPNATLMHILRVLIDKNFREEVISHVKDTVVLKFWRAEFDKWNDKQRDEAIAPITNKVGQFLSSKMVRNIFGQPRTKLNLRKAMDEGKIILVNLSKGRIGEDNANMIGSLLVTKFQIDAMSRADIPPHLRKPFYLYIDEFQNFMTGGASFASILSEARKYKLALIIANQYISQLLPEIKDAIFGNVGTTICMTIGSDDASQMTSQFKEMTSVNDLISLPKYTAYTRLMIDGISSDPFSMKTLPPAQLEGSLELIDKVRKQSRQRYAMSRDQLEKLMAAWNVKTFSAQEKIAEKAKLESVGVSEGELVTFENAFVQQHLHLFTEYAIDQVEPDAIIFDTKGGSHKALWRDEPKGLQDQATIKYEHGKNISLPHDKTMQMFVDIYTHQTIQLENNDPLPIWIGNKDQAKKQLMVLNTLAGCTENDSPMIFCLNFEKIQTVLAEEKINPPTNKNTPSEENTPSSSPSKNIVQNQSSEQTTFTIKDIKLGERYDGYIKLSYNYGMFVTVKGVEGLLHKNFITAPDGVDWKKYFNIGDKIKVKAKEFKDINGEKKVVWSQK